MVWLVNGLSALLVESQPINLNSQKIMALLEILIPTYKRALELKKCLVSLEKAVINLNSAARAKIGLIIKNNTTNDFVGYRDLIEKYTRIFEEMGVAYFDYHITGFNIGATNNIVGGLFSSKSQYVWVLPDDDIARFDALSVLITAIEKYSPCFISGAWTNKSIIQYNSNESGEDDGKPNSILDAIYSREKVSAFLSKNVVQLQEYIYNTQLLKKFLNDDSNVSLLNEMFPGLLAIFCLQSSAPFVRFERSLGIFRNGDPASEWRHLWYKFALIDWAILSDQCYQKGWLNEEERANSIAIFRPIISNLSTRPDSLLGLNKRNRINPFLLMKYHRHDFMLALKRSPLSIVKAIVKRLRKSQLN